MPKCILHILIFTFAALLFSCRSEFAKTRKKGSFQDKYAMAEEYYKKKDYYRSGLLYEDLLALSTGKKEAESTLLHYAYTQYYQKQYILASYHFKKFFETYPRHESVKEAIYMRAMSLYSMSPIWSLDQGNTKMAITAFQNFINRYPDSEFAPGADAKVDELQRKLEYKAYQNTKTYHKVQNYKSAVLAIDNFRLDYPSSSYNEELQFLKIKSQYELAKKSLALVTDDKGNIIHLKKNRLQDAKKFYYNFIDSYPNSEYLKEAEGIFRDIEVKLREFA